MTPDEILADFVKQHPELPLIEQRVRLFVRVTSKAVFKYQAAAIYHYAKAYDKGNALEIGTAYGYSCWFIAAAMPHGKITTLNPSIPESIEAMQSLSQFRNVKVTSMASWDFMTANKDSFDFIFVDGDNKRIDGAIPKKAAEN